MFSGLSHFPNQQIQIDSCDPVPNFMSRKWQGYQKQPIQMNTVVKFLLNLSESQVLALIISISVCQIFATNVFMIYLTWTLLTRTPTWLCPVVTGTSTPADPSSPSSNKYLRMFCYRLHVSTPQCLPPSNSRVDHQPHSRGRWEFRQCTGRARHKPVSFLFYTFFS